MTIPVACVILCAACATNPATGKRELSFYSESSEIRMGRSEADNVARSIGLYPDRNIQEYVAGLGRSLANRSERPQLPWSFQVVDDPAVNAFALPGGFIYVTRGILAYLNSEAELVGVLGHEIGHVTAKHSVHQMSQVQLAQIGLGIGMAISPELREFSGLTDTGLGLLFLRFSRDAENQADELGYRYALNGGYDTRGMIHVFETLDRVSADSGSDRLPQWMSTHPAPEDRIRRAEQRVKGSSGNSTAAAEGKVGRDRYLQAIDGLVFGENPRHGFFRNGVFRHPDLAFVLEFPPGWETRNGTQAVVGVSPRKDAIIAISQTGQGSPEAATEKFFSQEGVARAGTENAPINGLPAARSQFASYNGQAVVKGSVAFVSLDGSIYQILAYAAESAYEEYVDEFNGSIGSFRRLTDRTSLAVQPATIRLIRIGSSMTIEKFDSRYPSSIPIETLALINGVATGGTLRVGSLVKRVTGGENPGDR